jgi:hypothetical protein
LSAQDFPVLLITERSARVSGQRSLVVDRRNHIAGNGFDRYDDAGVLDESEVALRDHRWLKVPLSIVSGLILRGLIRAATRENVRYLSPHIWAFLQR